MQKSSLKLYYEDLVTITRGGAANGLVGVAIGSSRAAALVATRKIIALAEAQFP